MRSQSISSFWIDASLVHRLLKCSISDSWSLASSRHLFVSPKQGVNFPVFPAPFRRSECYRMLMTLLVIDETEPNSVFSSSDVVFKEVLTSRILKKNVALFLASYLTSGTIIILERRWLPVAVQSSHLAHPPQADIRSSPWPWSLPVSKNRKIELHPPSCCVLK